jgi:hypothetical protein
MPGKKNMSNGPFSNKKLWLTVLVALTTDFLHSDETNKNGVFIEADLLYWSSHISSLELSVGKSSIMQTVPNGITTTVMSEFDTDPHLKWDIGYRVGAGYQWACSRWSVKALWTHFQDRGTKHVVENSLITNATNCRVKLDQIDLTFSFQRDYYYGFVFNPFSGIRGAKIHESLHASILTDISLKGLPTTSKRSLNNHQNYDGIGPILGFETAWNGSSGLSVFGSVSGGILYGKSKVNFHDSNVFAVPISESIFNHTKKYLHRFDCNLDLAIGIGWETAFCDRYQLSFNLGFEHHQYFNQSHLGNNRGDLTFDGGVFNLKLVYKNKEQKMKVGSCRLNRKV